MGKLYNNEENEHHELIKTLRDLPRVKAPDNFEYNLLVKIKNKNFDSAKSYKRKVFTGWRLIPAAALVFSVVIIFFIFTGNNDENENPFMENPRPRENVTPVSNDAAIAGEITEEEKKSAPSEELIPGNQVAGVQGEQNNSEAKVFPFSRNNDVEIDKFLNGEKLPRSEVRSPVLVGNSRFNGFGIREQTSQKEILEMKAKFDSVMKSTKNVDTKKTKTE